MLEVVEWEAERIKAMDDKKAPASPVRGGG